MQYGHFHPIRSGAGPGLPCRRGQESFVNPPAMSSAVCCPDGLCSSTCGGDESPRIGLITALKAPEGFRFAMAAALLRALVMGTMTLRYAERRSDVRIASCGLILAT